uniref:Uncharacterized protein n=1 Tax=Arundo donax TaxID=35708 RepID=A0A0A9FQL5_ARUDO
MAGRRRQWTCLRVCHWKEFS